MNSSVKSNIKLAYILHYFPVLSETFVFDEIEWIRKTGVDVGIFVFDKPYGALMHTEAREFEKEAFYALNPKTCASSFFRVFMANFLFFLSSPVKFISYFSKYFFKLGKKEFSQIFYLGMLIKRYKPDYLHAHFAYLSAVSARIISDFTKVPFVVTIHARDMFVDNEYLEEIVRFAKSVIVKSEYNKKYLMEKCPWLDISKVKVIPCGVDADKFVPSVRNAEAGIKVISVGRLVEKKGFTYLLKACKILQQKGARFECEIYGDGPLKDNLSSEIKQLGLSEVVFLRGVITRQQLIAVFAISDIFVLPSIIDREGDTEAMPVALKEAMASTKAVVATDIAGIPELINSGEDGILVPSKDEKTLAQAMLTLINDRNLRLRLGDNARKKIIQNFTLYKNVQMIKELFC